MMPTDIRFTHVAINVILFFTEGDYTSFIAKARDRPHMRFKLGIMHYEMV